MKKILTMILVSCFLFACSGLTVQQKASSDALYRIALKRVLMANPKFKEPVLNILNAGKMALTTNSILTQDGVAQWISTQVASRFKNPDGTIDQDIQDLTYLILSAYLPQWRGSTAKFLNADDRKMLADLIDMSIMVIQQVKTSKKETLEELAQRSADATDEYFRQECRKNPKLYYCEFLK